MLRLRITAVRLVNQHTQRDRQINARRNGHIHRTQRGQVLHLAFDLISAFLRSVMSSTLTKTLEKPSLSAGILVEIEMMISLPSRVLFIVSP